MDFLHQQRILACAGYYHGKLDGDWGDISKAAQKVFDEFYATTGKQLGTFDDRTEKNIHTLLPTTQVAARTLLNTAKNLPFKVQILSGTRTYAEQHALFLQRPVVTRADAGQSNHNFGIAWDVGIFVNGEYYDGSDRSPAKAKLEEQAYIDLRTNTKITTPRVKWGGDWSKIIDRPHYEMVCAYTLKEIRALFEAGKSFI